MKKAIVAVLLLTSLPLLLAATKRTPRHRVVFDASTGEATWDGILNNVENLQKAFKDDGGVAMEVVAHGNALGMLRKDAKQAERIETLAASGVVFAACENTMRRQNVTREQLHPRAKTVPSGVAEVVKRQEAGWSYVKPGA